MNSKEIILANLNHENPPRCGMTFGGEGRINDMKIAGMSAAQNDTRRKWIEGEKEYYTAYTNTGVPRHAADRPYNGIRSPALFVELKADEDLAKRAKLNQSIADVVSSVFQLTKDSREMIWFVTLSAA